jgi:hypothetical protein
LYAKTLPKIDALHFVRPNGKVDPDRKRIRALARAAGAAMAGDMDSAHRWFCISIIGQRRYNRLNCDLKAALDEMQKLKISRAEMRSYLRAFRSRHESLGRLTPADVRRVFCIGVVP